MKRTALLIAAIIPLAFMACQKEMNPPEPAPPITGLAARTAELSRGSWELYKQVLIYGPNDIDSIIGDPCKGDDRYFFRTDGKAAVNWGPIECYGGTDSSGVYGNWNLFSNGDSLLLTYSRYMPGDYHAGDQVHYHVDFLSAEKMIITYIRDEIVKTYLVTETYVR